VRWPNPVRPGDALRLVADVIEVRRSEKRPTLGILRWRWRLFNQRESMVLDVEVTSLFRLDAADTRKKARNARALRACADA
jgi:acyl dehydratase